MDSQNELRSSKRCQKARNELTVKYEKRRAISLDEFTIPLRYFSYPTSCEWDASKSLKVILDDCSLYLTRKHGKGCSSTLYGFKNSDEEKLLQKLNDNTQCICHLLFNKSEESKPCHDLVASPGPRFLLRSMDIADSSKSASFRLPVSVPFKWEEVPGKPRKDAAVNKPDRSLQLPPRLLSPNVSWSGGSSPRRRKSQKARSYSQNRGSRAHAASMECCTERPIYCSPLIFRSTELSVSERKPKSVLNSCEINSPRSILSGPLLNSMSSSSDPNSMSDSETTSVLTAPLMEIWSDLAGEAEKASYREAENSVSRPDMQLVPYVECELTDLAPSLEVKPDRRGNRIHQSFKAFAKFISTTRSRWQKGKGKQKGRGISEVELWAPTLATYFQRVDRSKSRTITEKLRLLDNVEAGKRFQFEKRCKELLNGVINDNPGISSPSLCTCQCRDPQREQNNQLLVQSANNITSTLRSSYAHSSEKVKVEDKLHDRSTIRPSTKNCSEQRFLLLSPLRNMPAKWGSRIRMKVQAEARIETKSPLSLGLLVKAIKRPFASRKPDTESLALNPARGLH